MRTRSSSNLVGNSSSNPTTTNTKRRNRRRSKQPFSLEESPVATMADQRTMAELLRAPIEGYAVEIVDLPILAEHFELKHSLINMMTSDQFLGLEKDNPHDHIPTVGQTQNVYVARAYNQGGNTYQPQGANHVQNPTPAYQASAYQAPALAYQAPPYQAPVHQALIPQPQVVTNAEFSSYMKANDAIFGKQ
ncbi:hypothetical protein Tco_0237650 [Tanacetum coccineum]